MEVHSTEDSFPPPPWDAEVQEHLDELSKALDHPGGPWAFFAQREEERRAAERERFKDVPMISEAAEAEPAREEEQRARQRERRREQLELAASRSRMLLAEHSLDPSVWPRLLVARRCHGRAGAISFCLGVGIQPEVIAAVVAGLPAAKR